MGTEITTAVVTPTPQLSKSLSPQELSAHRQKISFEVLTVLSAYFKPNESEDIKAGQLAWWCDELQDWTREQVVYGLRHWNRENPRTRPTPGDIVKLLKALRGKKEAQRMQSVKPAPEPPKERATPEQVAAILAEAGFAPKRMEIDNED